MRGKITALLVAALLAGWAAPAWAHVTAENPSVPKDSDAEITFMVPVEEGGHSHAHAMHAMHEGHDTPGAGENQGEPSDVYNQEVTISVPRGFRVLSCDKTADWDCTAEAAKGSSHAGGAPGGTITFKRVTKSGTTMDHLSFTVHTPVHRGTYPFPTTQKTSDGDETKWNSDGRTGKNPAPTVQVTDRAASAEEGHDTGHT
jgi:uncharacterized protein YcnI